MKIQIKKQYNNSENSMNVTNLDDVTKRLGKKLYFYPENCKNTQYIICFENNFYGTNSIKLKSIKLK